MNTTGPRFSHPGEMPKNIVELCFILFLFGIPLFYFILSLKKHFWTTVFHSRNEILEEFVFSVQIILLLILIPFSSSISLFSAFMDSVKHLLQGNQNVPLPMSSPKRETSFNHFLVPSYFSFRLFSERAALCSWCCATLG